MVRSDVVDCFAEFGAVLGMFENFGANVSQSQASRRTFEQTDAELVLEVGNAAADGRGRQFETARRFRKAIRINNFGKNHQRIEVRHRYPPAPSSYRSHNLRTAHVLNRSVLRTLSQIWEIHLRFLALVAQTG